ARATRPPPNPPPPREHPPPPRGGRGGKTPTIHRTVPGVPSPAGIPHRRRGTSRGDGRRAGRVFPAGLRKSRDRAPFPSAGTSDPGIAGAPCAARTEIGSSTAWILPP